jgi:hypothetical protein
MLHMSPKNLMHSLTGPTKHPRPARTGATGNGRSLTIRHATPDDADALRRLAELDSSHEPRGAVLVADVAGELWAAVSLEDYHAVADPFRPSAELVWLLIQRARDAEKAERKNRRSRGWHARTAFAR